MSSLVLELQAEALDPKSSVTGLLRKALVVATKLDLPEIDNWIRSELNGYTGQPPPPYRLMKGEVVTWTPYHGWTGVDFGNAQVEAVCSEMPMGQSVGELEALLVPIAGSANGRVSMSLSPEMKQYLLAGADYVRPIAFHISPSSVAGVLEIVRTLVLEWSLALEKKDILGEGLRFTPAEKTSAQAATTIQHINHFYAGVSQSQFAGGAHAPVQNNTASATLKKS